MPNSDEHRFWRTFLKAVETKPLDVPSLVGASGLDHAVSAAGFDVKRKRLVLVSADHTAREAAFMCADVAAAHRQLHVIAARPLAINLSQAARGVVDMKGALRDLPQADLEKLRTLPKDHPDILQLVAPYREYVEALFFPLVRGFANFGPRILDSIIEICHQLSKVRVVTNVQPDTGQVQSSSLDFSSLLASDPTFDDQSLGLCPIPLYDLPDDAVETMKTGVDLEAARAILQRFNILQYFFPPPDHLALGLVERTPTTLDDLTVHIEAAEHLGHPLSEPQIVPQGRGVSDIIASLKDSGYIVQGKTTWQIEEKGRLVRHELAYKPQEGIVTRLINWAKSKLPKDLLKVLGEDTE